MVRSLLISFALLDKSWMPFSPFNSGKFLLWNWSHTIAFNNILLCMHFQDMLKTHPSSNWSLLSFVICLLSNHFSSYKIFPPLSFWLMVCIIASLLQCYPKKSHANRGKSLCLWLLCCLLYSDYIVQFLPHWWCYLIINCCVSMNNLIMCML